MNMIPSSRSFIYQRSSMRTTLCVLTLLSLCALRTTDAFSNAVSGSSMRQTFLVPSSSQSSSNYAIRPSTTTMMMMTSKRGNNPNIGSKNASRSTNLFRRSSNTNPSSILKSVIRTVRRRIAIFLTAAFLVFGPTPLPQSPINLLSPPSAHASTTTTSTPTPTKSHSKQSQYLQRLIDRYVNDHMFSEPTYDPLESAYRETINDGATEDYPTLLSQTASSALGGKSTRGTMMQAPSSVKADSAKFAKADNVPTFASNVIKKAVGMVDGIHARYGVSKSLLNLVVITVGLGAPILTVALTMISFAAWQKNMTEKMAMKRYGDSYTSLSAEEIEEEEEDEGGAGAGGDVQGGSGDDNNDDDDDDDDDDYDDDDDDDDE